MPGSAKPLSYKAVTGENVKARRYRRSFNDWAFHTPPALNKLRFCSDRRRRRDHLLFFKVSVTIHIVIVNRVRDFHLRRAQSFSRHGHVVGT